MELLTPGFGLIIFQALILVPIVLFLVAVFMLLMSSKIDPTKKNNLVGWHHTRSGTRTDFAVYELRQIEQRIESSQKSSVF